MCVTWVFVFSLGLTISFQLIGIPQSWGGLSAKDIMSKNDEVRRIETVVAHAKMVTGGGGSTERSKEFTWWRKLLADGVHFNTLTRFHFPPEVKGEGILFQEHEKDTTEVRIYLPTFKKIRRVESQQQSSSFMGSELSYSDISSPHFNDFTYKMIREESCLGEEHKSGKCWVIESVPVSDSVKERTGSVRAISWIRQDSFMATHVDYNDLDDKPWKKLDAGEIKEIDSKKHKWMAHRLRMETLKTQHFTTLKFDNVKANEPIADSTFTTQSLEREH